MKTILGNESRCIGLWQSRSCYLAGVNKKWGVSIALCGYCVDFRCEGVLPYHSRQTSEQARSDKYVNSSVSASGIVCCSKAFKHTASPLSPSVSHSL